MYSVVLMMALSGSADVPAFGHKGGCYGGCYGSCYGSGCHGCSGSYGCSGCMGSSCHGCHGGGHFLGGRGGCHGCHGGGMLGHKRSHGCHGGCYGSCSGYSCSGGYGCYGSCSGYSCSGGYGCYGSCMGAGCMGAGCMGAVPAMGAPSTAPKAPEKIQAPKKETLAPAPATIYVSLPAAAKLSIDDVPTTSTTAERLFVSPNLQPDRDYFYTLTAEVVRDGKTVTVSRKVTVHAGEATRIALELPEASVAQK